MRSSPLYAVIDKKTSGRRKLFDIAKQARNAGIGIIQLRDKISSRQGVLKEAQRMRKLLSGDRVLFIVNDYPEIAAITESDGLHLGQSDISIGAARAILGKERIIGVSCHSLAQALRAQEQGADYISVGPIFPTPTKPEYKAVGLGLIDKVSKAIKIPFFVIGGINERNLAAVLCRGARGVAVCRPVCRSRDLSLAARRLLKRLEH